MALTDIEEKKAEERKREKRLVHFTNTTVRKFIEFAKLKSKNAIRNAEYITRSLLDYIFFQLHKEITEFNEGHMHNFLTEYAPQKLEIDKEKGKEAVEILTTFLDYLGAEGYIKNSLKLKRLVKENTKEFLKLLPAQKKSAGNKSQEAKKAPVIVDEVKVGRNDPCPCGSGKKYKKCCGKNK